MALDYKTATIFDLTDDSALIAEVLGYETTRSEYLATIPAENYCLDMLAFAEATNNAELQREIGKACEVALSSFFNE